MIGVWRCRYDQYYDGWDTSITTQVCGENVRFFHAKKQGVDRVFIDHPSFLAKVWGKTGSKLYGEKSGSDFKDNQKRFRLFCGAAIEATRKLPFGPGENCTFIANDWHSGLVPVLLKDVSAFTISLSKVDSGPTTSMPWTCPRSQGPGSNSRMDTPESLTRKTQSMTKSRKRNLAECTRS